MSSEHATAEKDVAKRVQPEAQPEESVSSESNAMVRRSPRSTAESQAADLFAQRSASGQASFLRQIQRSHGNRYAQRVIAQMRATALRQCHCGGTCESCKAHDEAAPLPSSTRLVQARYYAQLQSETDTPQQPPVPDKLDLQPSSSTGTPLEPGARDSMEAHFGRGFGSVRVHTGPEAARAAASIQADAYTIGRDIYFGAGKYQPDSSGGRQLLAHELTHVVQQDAGQRPTQVAPSHESNVIIGAPHDPLEKEAESNATRFASREQAGPSTQDPSNVVRREWTLKDNPITNTLSAGAQAIGSGVQSGIQKGKEFVIAQIEKYAPGAISFFRGIADYFKAAIGKGVNGLFGGVVASIREKGISATLGELLGQFASGALKAAAGFISGECAAWGKAAEHLIDVASKLGGAALAKLKQDLADAGATLSRLWGEYGTPAVEFVKTKLKAIWEDVEKTASRIWGLLKPLRDLASDVWDTVTGYLAEGRKTVSDWLEGFIPKALAAWEELKKKIQPFMDKIKFAMKIIAIGVVLLSPLGPFVVLGGLIYGVYYLVKLAWDKWGKKFTHDVREWWVKTALPGIQKQLHTIGEKLAAAREAIAGFLSDLADTVTGILAELGALPILNAVQQAIEWFSQKVVAAKNSIVKTIGEWNTKLHSLIAAAQPYIELIKEGLRQTLLVTMFGPLAILDDGVWGTANAVVNFALKTPCLRELAGLLRVPSALKKIGEFRQNIKAAWKLIHNPGPLMEALKKAIQPMVDNIEPGIKRGVLALAFSNAERQLVIHASIIAYLADSLVELAANWWPTLKQIGWDLLWPWDTVGKEFMPMIDLFGKALSELWNLDFSIAIDDFLEGTRKFNGIVGALSGWFMLASVLVGAALGALGFVTGPGGVATVGAGASAGLAVAEEVGLALLVLALATEAAIAAKAYFNLQFQNTRIEKADERNKQDQEDCKKIASSAVAVATIGALMLLGDIAARFGKWLASIVEKVPLLKDIAALLKTAKKKIADFGPEGKAGAKAGDATGGAGDVAAPKDGAAPKDTSAPDAAPKDAAPDKARTDAPDDASGDPAAKDNAAKAEEKGIPREQYQAEMRTLREKSRNPENIRRPKDPRFDVEMDADGHTYDRENESSWCRRSEEVCGIAVDGDVNANADKALEEKGPPEKTPEDVKDDPNAAPDDPAGPEAVDPAKTKTKMEFPENEFAPDDPAWQKWPPDEPPKTGPDWDQPGGARWRWDRYRWEKWQKGETVGITPKEYFDRWIEPKSRGQSPGEKGSPEHVAATNKVRQENGLGRPENVGKRRPDAMGDPGKELNIPGLDDPVRPHGEGRVIYEADNFFKDGSQIESEGRAQVRDLRKADPEATIVVQDAKTGKVLVYEPGTQPPPPGRLPADSPTHVPFPGD